MVVDSKWYPECYLDEVMPPGRADPSAWIVDIGGAAHLAGLEQDGDQWARPLRDGDTVRFFRCDTHDEIELRLAADGHALASEPPAEFEQCCVGGGWQGDTLAESVDEMVAGLREADAPPGDYDVFFYTYFDTGPWRFVAESRTFEQVQS
ncbi:MULTISPECIES: hypothetical protein [Methylosinus]|uniref:hypothetical protein n=1 Tax=Methylosinus TaxID=425 RepID=UPI00163DE65A|nr:MULTISPECIES: hypothetical protein [Methylosinus]MBU3887722.1 hypothetical protein [Methylosinus sp. KRF6]